MLIEWLITPQNAQLARFRGDLSLPEHSPDRHATGPRFGLLSIDCSCLAEGGRYSLMQEVTYGHIQLCKCVVRFCVDGGQSGQKTADPRGRIRTEIAANRSAIRSGCADIGQRFPRKQYRYPRLSDKKAPISRWGLSFYLAVTCQAQTGKGAGASKVIRSPLRGWLMVRLAACR